MGSVQINQPQFTHAYPYTIHTTTTTTTITHTRRTLAGHSHAAVRLGQALFPLFALALDLPEDFFADKVRLVLLCVVTVVIGWEYSDTPGSLSHPGNLRPS